MAFDVQLYKECILAYTTVNGAVNYDDSANV